MARVIGRGAGDILGKLPYILVYKSNFLDMKIGLKKSTSTYIRENMRHTFRITKKCQNSLQQAKLRS